MSPEEKKKTEGKENVVRRRAIILGIVAAVAVLLVIGVKLWIRQPEVSHPPVDDPVETQKDDVVQGRREGVYTIMLLGRDTGGGGNTDTIMVATYDTVNLTMDIMNIYRDTMVNAPWDLKRINSVYNANGGGEKGIEALKGYLEGLLGFVPDYYVTIEWAAVGELVDAIGGVEFDVPYDMKYWDPTQNLRIDQAKGYRTLYGDDAMQVIRWRKNNDGSGISVGDTGRVAIQQDFLRAVAKKCLNTINLGTVSKYAKIVQEHVTTDLTVGNMAWLVQRSLALDLDWLNFHSLPGNLNGTAWSRTTGNYQSYVLPDGEGIVELVNSHFNPYTYDIKLEDLDIMSVNPDGSLSSSQGVVKDTPAAAPPVKPSKVPESEESEPTEVPPEPTGEALPSEEPMEPPIPPVEEGLPGAEPSEEVQPSVADELPIITKAPVEAPEPTEENTTQVLPAMPTPVA